MAGRDFYQAVPVGEAFSTPTTGIVTGCIWIDGIHAYCENPNCPEANQNIGWTVQQADADASLISELAKKGNSNASRQE